MGNVRIPIISGGGNSENILAQIFHCEEIAIDDISFDSTKAVSGANSFSINHSLGKVPKIAILKLVQWDFTKTSYANSYCTGFCVRFKIFNGTNQAWGNDILPGTILNDNFNPLVFVSNDLNELNDLDLFGCTPTSDALTFTKYGSQMMFPAGTYKLITMA